MMKLSKRQIQRNEATDTIPSTAINDVSLKPRDEFEDLSSILTTSGNQQSFINDQHQPHPTTEQIRRNETTDTVLGTAGVNEVSPSQPRGDFEDRCLNFTESAAPGAYSVPGNRQVSPWPAGSSSSEEEEEFNDDTETHIIPGAELVDDDRHADLENRVARLNEVVLAYQNTVVAEMVEDQPSPSSSDAAIPFARKRMFLSLLALSLFLFAIIVTTALYFTRNRDQPSPTMDYMPSPPTITPTMNSTTYPAVTETSTRPPRRFQDLYQLTAAVDDYLYSNGDVHFIGDWDVSEVTEMNDLFSANRNDRTKNFNEDISCWNTAKVRNTTNMFLNAASFNQNLTIWDTSAIQDMSHMFEGASLFNGDVSKWDVARVQDMTYLFSKATSFNQNLSKWNTSSVENMAFMFQTARAFNGDISAWDVSRVQSMTSIFAETNQFNQPLTLWNIGNVESMHNAFYFAVSFDGNISSWDVSRVSNFVGMFFSAVSFNNDISSWNLLNARVTAWMFESSNFNSDISQWDVRSITNMTAMFRETKEFNQDISSWDTSGVTDMNYMFQGALAYNANIAPWNVSSVTSMDKMFYGANLFNQNLCAWSNMLKSDVTAKEIFGWTDCPFEVYLPSQEICQTCS